MRRALLIAIMSISRWSAADPEVCVDQAETSGEVRIANGVVCWRAECFAASATKPFRRVTAVPAKSTEPEWQADGEQLCNTRTGACKRYGKKLAAAAQQASLFKATWDGKLVVLGPSSGPDTIWNLAKDEMIVVDPGKVPAGAKQLGIDPWTNRFTSTWAPPTKGRELMVVHDETGRALGPAVTSDTTTLLSDNKHLVLTPYEGPRLTVIDLETGAVRGLDIDPHVAASSDIVAPNVLLATTLEHEAMRLDWIDLTPGKPLALKATKRLPLCAHAK